MIPDTMTTIMPAVPPRIVPTQAELASNSFFRRLAAGAVAVAVSGAAAVVTTVAASAAPGDGTLAPITPATGDPATILFGTTSAPCPDDGGTTTSYNVEVQGPGTFAGTFTSNSSAGFSTTQPLAEIRMGSFADFAAATSQTVVAGQYVLTLRCVSDFNVESRRFTGSLTFTDATHYTVGPNGSPGPSRSPSPSPTTTPTPTATASPTPTATASPTPTATASPTATPSPTETSTTTPTPSDSATPSANDIGETSATSDPSDGTQSLSSTGTLANTGAPIGLIFLGGLLLLAVGLAMIVWRQRPRRMALGGGDEPQTSGTWVKIAVEVGQVVLIL